ncbi:F-box/WD repeat-containing protein 8 [Bombina bombina]|uniref:F-box/WD repeat-containing protein 8 n=1 Tax=Bombina bombina TaxID=8345 RepID=UPI00235B0F1D|nr:F-box/WD repeat-containing protein 8 [Bombina bombina]
MLLDMALDISLEEFRRRWEAEIREVTERSEHGVSVKRRRSGEGSDNEDVCEERAWRRLPGSPQREVEEVDNGYLELAERLLEDKPKCTPRDVERPCCIPLTDKPISSFPARAAGNSLVDQLICDLNDINEIPFFDIQLPYEIALQIFQYLGMTELGRCAQVSKTWKFLAEDEVLWHRLCQKEGYTTDEEVSTCTAWKNTLRDKLTKESMLKTNWKNRIGAVSQLHYELGKVLCDVHSCDGVVLAGYTSGDVRLWDTRASCFAGSSLETTQNNPEIGHNPQVSFVRINRSLAVAVYNDGTVDVWSLHIGRKPIHHYQHNQKIQAVALCSDAATIATASGFQVKMECPDERGYWRSISHFQTQKLVNFLHLVHDYDRHPVAIAAAEEIVYLFKEGEPEKILHSTYDHPVTCLDVTLTQAAFGVRSFGWFSNHGNKIYVYNLQTSQCVTTLGNSTGEYTCMNLKDSPPHLLVTGNKDRRVRVYDMRCSKSLCSFYAHHLGVSAAYMDDWKVVSGGEEGLTCVWDQRMGTKLWEMHARHPVRYIWFNSQSLVTANIPDEKNPRGASIMDDDLTAHRRHRGTINVYEFSVDQRSVDSILPICRSSYSEVTGYNYNIGLAVPYDLV